MNKYRFALNMIFFLKTPWLLIVATALSCTSTICLAETSINDGIFLSRPGSLPRGYQNDNLNTNEVESNPIGLDMSLDSNASRNIAKVTPSGMTNPSKCRLNYFDPLQQVGINIRSAIIFSVFIFFIGLMLDISILPPFMRFVPEDEISGYKYTWRLIIIIAMLGGSLIPSAINVVRESGLYNGHSVSSEGSM